MHEQELKAPSVDRPLDPSLAAKVSRPGVGVIVTPKCDFVNLVREASDVANVRSRELYVFLVWEDHYEVRQDIGRWREEIFQKCHDLKVECMVISRSQLLDGLEDFCVHLDIRILMVEETPSDLLRLPWMRSLSEELSYAPQLPPTFVLRRKEFIQEKSFVSRNADWITLFVSIFVIAIYGLSTSELTSDSIDIMLYILMLAILSTRVRRIVSLVGSILAGLSYNIIHVAPVGVLQFTSTESWINFFGLVIVSLIISTLGWQLRLNLKEVQIRQRNATSYFGLTRELLQSRDVDSVIALVERHIQDVVGGSIAVYIKRSNSVKALRQASIDISASAPDQKSLEYTLEHGIESGLGTKTNPVAYGCYFPVTNRSDFAVALALYPTGNSGKIDSDMLNVLDTYIGLLGIAFERIYQEENQREQEKIVRDSEIQNTLLRSVSHDLKTPLTSIAGFANQLYEDPGQSSEVRLESYRTIRDEAWRLTNLINNLLSLTKLESEAMQLNKERMFAEEIIGSAIGLCRTRLTKHELEVDLPDDVSDVEADPLLINQALVNMIENAAKYSPEGSKIIVCARNEGKDVMFSVMDEGPGIPEDKISEIFEKFVRLDNGRKVEGTGLGLNIVRTVAELHGGRVAVANRTRRGASFNLLLPAMKKLELSEEHE